MLGKISPVPGPGVPGRMPIGGTIGVKGVDGLEKLELAAAGCM